MKKFQILPLIINCSNSWNFNTEDLLPSSSTHNLWPKLELTKKNCKKSQKFFNKILLGLIAVSGFSNFILYRSINNPQLEALLLEKKQYTLEEIKFHIKSGFIINSFVTCALIYTLYQYNQSQKELNNGLKEIEEQKFLD